MKKVKPTKKPILDFYEQKIAQVILKAKVKLTTTQIAEILKLDWRKTKLKLESLYRKAPISRQTLGNRIYWFVKRK